MIMLNVWHPSIIEFIISKMQNPHILRHIIATTKDAEIKKFAEDKLKFEPLSDVETSVLKAAVNHIGDYSDKTVQYASQLLKDGGRYSVHNPDFLSGANISVGLTHEFMQAVENDEEFALQFPDVESYNEYDMALYDDHWHEIGDVREWAARGMAIKTYRTIKARELWNLINICATYSAEPGVFFIDNANDMTNAKAYGQQVVCTNPCGEQPLAPYSVCNLAAINLANMVDKQTHYVDFARLEETVRIAVRAQDNVIDATPYFLEANEKQAKGERRIGLGVMGLADMLIYCEAVYGSAEGNAIVDEVFKTIAVTAYETSIELAKEKGSFPFLKHGYYGDDIPGKITELLAEGKTVRSPFGKIRTVYEDGAVSISLRSGENGIARFTSEDFYIERSGDDWVVRNKPEGEETPTEAFINTGFMRSMPEHIRQGVLEHGIRNSHLLTVAPTGSTGSMIGVATGLEPYFAFKYYRSGRLGKFMEVNANIVQEYLDANHGATADNLPEYFVSAMELTPEQHADTQCVIQRWVDSSISKTVNAPKGYTVAQVQAVYERLYKGGAKGGTIYVDGSRDTQVLTLEASESKVDDSHKTLISDTIPPLEQTDVKVGTEVGDTCPVCRKGHVIDAGGCSTCDNCGAQLKCGL